MCGPLTLCWLQYLNYIWRICFVVLLLGSNITRIKNWQKWCWIWDFKPQRKARYTIQSHDQSSSLRVVFVWKNRLQSHNRAAAEILKGRGLIKSTNIWQRIPLMSHGNQFFPYFGVDDISSHVCIQCQTCVPIISQLDLLYTEKTSRVVYMFRGWGKLRITFGYVLFCVYVFTVSCSICVKMNA